LSQTSSATVKIRNKLGLHARPAMLFVETACTFQSAITVRRCDQSEKVDGKSIMQMMMLAATQGTGLEIAATGADAEKATRKLVALIESCFGEE
jgi:phosphocarrier protein